MKPRRLAALLGLAVTLFVLGALPRGGASQVPQADKPAGERFDFEVVESFDARYQGDTPGHMGRHGGLGEVHPQVALGDLVYRDDKQVGVVTGLKWSRAQGALDVEFDPSARVRISVGDIVWVKLGGERPAQ